MHVQRILPALPVFLLPVFALLVAYPDGPDPRLTAGFGEENCSKCHTGHGLNAGRSLGGDFRIEGVPPTYEPGTTYRLTLVLSHPGQSRWGFELSSRFATDGRQAGLLAPFDNKTQVENEGGIQYAKQTMEGSRAGHANGPIDFHLDWTAPETAGQMVIFNAAGNAANGDDTAKGDFVYSAGAYSTAADQPLPAVMAAQAVSDRKPPLRLNQAPTLVNLPIPLDRRKGEIEFQVQHRFLGDLDSGIGNQFGVDNGANVNLSLDFGVTERLSVAAARAQDMKVVNFAGTYEIHNGPDSKWAMSVVAGVEGRDNFEFHYSPYVQLSASLDYGRLRAYLTPTMIFNSRVDEAIFPGIPFVNPEDNHTFSLGLGADLAITPRLSVVGEAVPRLWGFGGILEDRTSYAAGVKLRTWRHVFTIFVTRSQDFTPSLYGVNANRFGDDVSLGFNVLRRMH